MWVGKERKHPWNTQIRRTIRVARIEFSLDVHAHDTLHIMSSTSINFKGKIYCIGISSYSGFY